MTDEQTPPEEFQKEEPIRPEDAKPKGDAGAPPPKQPMGPGLLIVVGVGFLALAAVCGWDIYQVSQEGVDKTSTWYAFNYGGLVGGIAIAIYCFILGGIRWKKGIGVPPEDEE